MATGERICGMPAHTGPVAKTHTRFEPSSVGRLYDTSITTGADVKPRPQAALHQLVQFAARGETVRKESVPFKAPIPSVLSLTGLRLQLAIRLFFSFFPFPGFPAWKHKTLRHSIARTPLEVNTGTKREHAGSKRATESSTKAAGQSVKPGLRPPGLLAPDAG